MADADQVEPGPAGTTDGSLPGTADSEGDAPDRSDASASLTGLPRWTFAGMAKEEDSAAPPVEPPAPPSADLTADQAPALPSGTISSPPALPTVPAVDVPAVDVPAVDVPAVDVPAVDVPAVDVPAVDVPAVDVPAVDVPASDAPAVVVAANDVPAVDVPAVDVPAVDVPASDAPAVVVAASDVAASDVPASDVPAVDASAVDLPAVAALTVDAPASPATESEEPGAEVAPAVPPASLPPPLPETTTVPAAAPMPPMPARAAPVSAVSTPPAPWGTPAPIQPLAVPWLGPVGKHRHPAVVVVLSVITLGFYSLLWHAKVNREMADFDARIEVRSGTSALGVTLAWLVGLLTSLAGVAVLVTRSLHVGPTPLPREAGFALLGGLAVIPYLVLLLSPAFVALVMTLERLRVVQERVGVRPDGQVRPVARACLLLLPIVGGLWHLAAFQSKLNRVWRDGDLTSRSDLARRPY